MRTSIKIAPFTPFTANTAVGGSCGLQGFTPTHITHYKGVWDAFYDLTIRGPYFQTP